MKEIFQRTGLLLGDEAMKILASKRVAVFGIGGVGSYAVEALARSGIGALELIDRDTISKTNINRQIIALHSTVGRYKAEVAKERVLDINPDIKVNAHCVFYTPDTSPGFDFSEYDYIIDAIDTVTGKIELVLEAKKNNVPIISAMGAGNKLEPTAFEVSDIYKTSVCPLARVMRRELKKRGIERLKVVYSKEEAISIKPEDMPTSDASRRSTPGSVAFVPSAAGLIIAGEVIKDLAFNKVKNN